MEAKHLEADWLDGREMHVAIHWRLIDPSTDTPPSDDVMFYTHIIPA